jgi:hypothetical protein
VNFFWSNWLVPSTPPPPSERGGHVSGQVLVRDLVALRPGQAIHVLAVVAELSGEEEVRGEDALVPAAEVRAAHGDGADVRRGRADDGRDGARVVRRIAEDGADERVRVGEVPGQLAGVEIAARLRVRDRPDLLVRALRDLPLERVAQPVVRAEEPEPVLDDVAAEVEAPVVRLEADRMPSP